MRILFIDDQPDGHAPLIRTLREAFEDGEVAVADSLEAAREHLADGPWDVVVLDIFLPLTRRPEQPGRLARKYEENVRHLGGLVILDDIARMRDPPPVLGHSEASDPELLQSIADHLVARVPKPASPAVLLRAILDVVLPPEPGGFPFPRDG